MDDEINLSFNTSHLILGVFLLGLMVGFFGGAVAPVQITNSQAQQAELPSPDTQKDAQDSGNEGVEKSKISITEEPVLGNEDAEVTIVEFSDYQCPFCRSFYSETFGQIKTDYIDNGEVKFVYKDFPLEQLGHDNAVQMAEAAECASDQDRYWDMHDKMFEEQNEISPRRTAKFDSSKISQWAEEIGLNMDEYNQCMESDEYAEEVQHDLSEGQSLGVSGTPTFFIYSETDERAQKLVGAQPYSRFKQVIDSKLKN